MGFQQRFVHDCTFHSAGFQEKVKALLAELEQPPPVLGNEEQRASRAAVVDHAHRALAELHRAEATAAMRQGRSEEAVAAARTALKFTLRIHGEGAIEIVPAYLLLAEATLALGRHSQVLELLSMANWTVVRAGGRVPNELRSAMHRNFGKLYAAQGKLEEALTELARDAYYCALQVGPDHIDATAAYFHMASIFLAQDNTEAALAFFDRVVDSWFKYLVAATSAGDSASSVPQSQLEQASNMLHVVTSSRKQLLGEEHVAVGEAYFTLALLHAWQGQHEEALGHGEQALGVYRGAFGDDHGSTADVAALVQQQQEAIDSAE